MKYNSSVPTTSNHLYVVVLSSRPVFLSTEVWQVIFSLNSLPATTTTTTTTTTNVHSKANSNTWINVQEIFF